MTTGANNPVNSFPFQDFRSVKACVEEVVYIATLRENQKDLLRVQKAQELKNLAKGRGISFQKNIRKADMVDLLVYRHCTLIPIHIHRFWFMEQINMSCERMKIIFKTRM